MKTPSRLLSISIGLAMATFPTYAYAATSDEVTGLLFEETTAFLEIEIKDTDLAESLFNDLKYAIQEEVIDPEIAEEIEDTIDSEREPSLDELFDENLEEQEESWLDKSPELLNAFDLVKFEFHQCRSESTGGSRECAQGLGFKLQAASIQLALANLEEQKAALGGLEGVELEEALALLSNRENDLARKLARAQEKLDRFGEGKSGSTELLAAVSEARDAGITIEGKQGNQGNGNGNQGNGNGNGNQGNGNGNGNQGNGGNG